jgi:hypothetical protein
MKLRFAKFLLIVLLLFSFSKAALADPGGLYVTEGLLPYDVNFNSSPTGVTQRLFLSSETGLGYIIDGWFYLGGIFNYTAVNEQTTDSAGTFNHQETFQYYGPTVGYMTDSWYFLVHYFANAEKKDILTGAATGNYDNTGNGFGIGIGYKFPVGGIELAPVLSFKSITYTNCKDPSSGATATCNPSIQQTEIDPYFTLLFNFK